MPTTKKKSRNLYPINLLTWNRAMIRAIIDDRIRRVWVILFGMTALAVIVEAVTIMIHARIA
jgi:hypothetical protein